MAKRTLHFLDARLERIYESWEESPQICACLFQRNSDEHRRRRTGDYDRAMACSTSMAGVSQRHHL